MIEQGGLPDLTDPVLVTGFEGWNDAGESATGAVEHLEQLWSARRIAALDPEDYYDFQVNRPTVTMGDGTRSISWPTTRLAVTRPPGTDRDLVLLRGIEPSVRWRTFTAELIEYAERIGIQLVVNLGALLAESPHSRPVPISGTTSDPDLEQQLSLEPSRYEGPTGIVGVFQDACAQAGLPAISFWAAVPHYVASMPCPKATLALLRRVEDVLDLTVPLGDLPARAKAWQQNADELVAEDSDIAEYVRQLEEAKDTADLPEASGEFIAREFERYLRRRHEHGEGGSPRQP